ncbi:sarcosine oxidase subunit alpha family protein [Komagataeibacter oboediens]|uniref:sarcosine oxidase subunit alpha family protein n=1 Tax=Komagataeibacter oboediens TaxID=65958 RepID=UPI001C2BA52A|nr:sarcosine oxidase subunit alpha family protein [Komagataeibacter oboediens]MBV0888346.1 sarcosine oxidase subunit alpha family protein [Komagataeibacter oboediens]MCK9820317.1 sarcosine oxidase subunit alpha family protein [Komagataeibacter oboediens]
MKLPWKKDACSHRLSGQAGRRIPANGIDPDTIIRFTFDGISYDAHPGDTLASALLANGQHLAGRSFKYHRPRGILTAGPEEPNALMELRTGAWREPNSRATVTEVFDGLDACSQNRWPSLRMDALGVNGLFSPLFTAGFYYKTFMWPAAFWEKVYEPLIRRAAGLGWAADEADPDLYEKITTFCDVLVVGSGPAGLAAALVAGRSGARVILCEQDSVTGGRLRAERTDIDGVPGWQWADRTVAALRQMPEVRIMTRTCVFGTYDGGTYGALERVADHVSCPASGQPRQRLWRIVARRCIVAGGGIERPLVFPNNDRPGIMLAGAVRTYINRFGVVTGQRAIVFTNNDDGLRTAVDLKHAGATVTAIVDTRTQASDMAQRVARDTGARLFTGGAISNTYGRLGVHTAAIRDRSGRVRHVACDLIAMSGGWNPELSLTTHLGAKPVYDPEPCAFTAGSFPPGMLAAGVANGTFMTADCLHEGAARGQEAAAACGFDTELPPLPAAPRESYGIQAIQPAPQDQAGRDGKAFIDFQNDVTAKDVRLAAMEGFRCVEHVKRYTTLGMATDQGKTSNINGLAALAQQTGQNIAQTGTTMFRPPVQPVAIGALAGAHRGRYFKPDRLPPTHEWARQQGAVFTANGIWHRAQWFPQDGETHWRDTVNREVRTVRTAVGFCDVTTLGKIDIQGPDAATFLDRLYINGWQKLPVGRVRYGLMLREDGFAFDDGTTARLGEQHYVMTTTTAHAGAVMQHMELCHQWLWPELDVHFISVTDEWAQMAIAGPRSRDVLRHVVDPDTDLSNDAFGYMHAAEITICGGQAARLFRLSFSGELAYELAVPARYGDALARLLMKVGAPYGIAPYGTEALGVMRIEKGHPAGPELNGQTTAHDLNMGRMLSTRKDFIGRAMAARPALTDPVRPTLVGLRPVHAHDELVAGSHLLPHGAEATGAHDQGWISSAAWSPTLDGWIALGFLSGGPARHGEMVMVHNPLADSQVAAVVCPPTFFDPAGDRLHA